MAAKTVDGQPSGPVVIAIDPTAPFAGLFLTAALTWPRSERERQHGLAAWAAMGLAELEVDGSARAQAEVQAAMADAARKHGCSVEDILADPLSAKLPERGAQFLVEHARHSLRQDLFEVAGGWSAIAGAPPVDQAMAQVRRIARMEGNLVGQALSLSARMARHHPEHPASLNRSWHIIETAAKAAGRPVPSDRAIFMRMWREWSDIAPLQAAVRLWLDGARFEADPRAHAEELFSTVGVGSVLGWAKWLRRWAIGYVPDRARQPLLLNASAATYETQVPELEPPLLPLSSVQLAAASAHRAPTQL